MKAFTLIELLVVIALLSILGAIGAGTLPQFQKNIELDAFAESVTMSLEKARAETLSSKNALQYGVHSESGRIVIFSGTVFVEGASGNEIITAPSSAEIATIALSGGGADVVFKRLTGTTDQYGTITIRRLGDATVTRTISIMPTGRVSIAP